MNLVDLTWLDASRLDDRDVAGAVAVLEAARAVDRPYHIAKTVTSFTGFVRYGWDYPPHVAVARDGRGRVTGVLVVLLPDWDNTHAGAVDVTVDPAVRRQGLGRRLFRAGADRLRAAGRTLLRANCPDHSAGVPFAKAMGLEQAFTDVHRRQDLLAVDWVRLDREYEQASERAAGYELLRLPGPTPPEMMADIAAMTEAINDAPTDELELDDEVFHPERIRAFEAALDGRQQRFYRLVARERETGLLAGHTMVAVEREQPGYGWQLDTSVRRGHRGHRLGLLLKIAMLRWLAEEEPQLRTIDTGNAASNSHMIKVNEILGYQAVSKGTGWQRRL